MMPQLTAVKDYSDKQAEVRAVLSEIRVLLRRHAKEQAKHPHDMGFGGDLCHVAEELRDVAGFLAGGKR